MWNGQSDLHFDIEGVSTTIFFLDTIIYYYLQYNVMLFNALIIKLCTSIFLEINNVPVLIQKKKSYGAFVQVISVLCKFRLARNLYKLKCAIC
jgi:hypothetical protein